MSASTRRQFLATTLTVSSAAAQTGAKKRRALPPVLGVCTTALERKDGSIDKLIEALKPLKLPLVSLGAPHFDPWTGSSSRLAEMREMRTRFTDASILVRSVTVDITAQRTDAEIARMLAMANALDVRHVAADVPAAMLNRVNNLARQQGMIVALLNGGRSEIDSVSAFQNAVHSYGSLGIALSVFPLEAKGGDPLELLRTSSSRILEIRFRPVGSRTAGLLSAVRYRHSNIPVLIDVPHAPDIPGAVEFFREAIRQKPPEQPRRTKDAPASSEKKK